MLSFLFHPENGSSTFFQNSLNSHQSTWGHIWEDSNLQGKKNMQLVQERYQISKHFKKLKDNGKKKWTNTVGSQTMHLLKSGEKRLQCQIIKKNSGIYTIILPWIKLHLISGWCRITNHNTRSHHIQDGLFLWEDMHQTDCPSQKVFLNMLSHVND